MPGGDPGVNSELSEEVLVAGAPGHQDFPVSCMCNQASCRMPVEATTIRTNPVEAMAIPPETRWGKEG